MLRKVGLGAIFLLGLAVVVAFQVGGQLAAPRQTVVGPPPSDLSAEAISIPRLGASPIAGWYTQAKHSIAGVLLLHGVRSDRREMLGRARFLIAAGYAVLLIDMQGHGQTDGEKITFGYKESRDVRDALRYLRWRLPGKPVGVIGVSLGGAAILLGDPPVNAQAIVVEAVYSSIGPAIGNRLAIRFGPFGRLFLPLLLCQLEPRLGISLEELSPLTGVREVRAPILIISGDADRHTLLAETEALFQGAPEPKRLWVVKGAAHQDLHRYAREEYERKIIQFFGDYLHGA